MNRALNLDELSAALANKGVSVQFFDYSELPKDHYLLASMLLSNPPRFLFFERSTSGDIGHWTALKRFGRHLFWFSSYGFLPDGELMVSSELRGHPGQGINKISRALKYLDSRGFTIHYSAIPLQVVGDGTTSCGAWCYYFLVSKFKDFEKFEDRLSNISIPERFVSAIYKNDFSS